MKIRAMTALKYTVIKSDKQYDKYCNILHDLDFSAKKKTKAINDEIDLLIVLIEKWDAEHRTFRRLDPVELIKSLMKDHKMKAKDLAALLDVNKSYVSEVLNYKKGFSKDVIRKLAERFKMNQEAFNRPYELHVPVSSKFKDAKMMNTRKKLATAS